MKGSNFNEKELTEAIEHIVHDNLPIATFSGGFIVPSGSKELEHRPVIDTYVHPEYGDFVITGPSVI